MTSSDDSLAASGGAAADEGGESGTIKAVSNPLSSRIALETTEIAIASSASCLELDLQDGAGGSVRRIKMSPRSPVTIGSRRGVDIRVRDRTVSARHCVVSAENGGITVKDLGSKNGTYVGGARIREARCQVGMTIIVGQTSLTCIRHDGGVSGDDEPYLVSDPIPGIAGGSRAMCRVAMLVRRFAKLRAPVLIAGETGVGKELVARALHAQGQRSNGPFVPINASTLPRDLVETELFGHEKGAFTGAVSKRPGAFDIAEGGSLFLDEIGELPLDAQPKLLRVLDGYEVRSVGSTGAGRRADVRVIAATHVPLLSLVRVGRFRRDLYHRLEVLVIHLPPLRDRPGDILPIARALLETMRDEHGERELTPAAVACLTGHDWPGNVRELRNVLTRAADIGKNTDERWIGSDAVHHALRQGGSSVGPNADSSSSRVTHRLVRRLHPRRDSRSLPMVDDARALLKSFGGNVSAAARAANIPRTTFRKILARDPADDDE